MDIPEIIFTYLAPILYNVLFLSLWILWFIFHHEKQDRRLNSWFQAYLKKNIIFYPVTAIMIVVFLYLLFGYAIANTDVDDAITTAVQEFLNGHNPYTEDVVEHHISINGTPTTVLGRYHYFPPDLLTYSLFYMFIGNIFYPILETYWFVPLHFILLIPSYWIVVKIVEWPHHRRLPLFLLLVTPYLFTNSILMLFFFLLGYYLFEVKEQYSLGMVFYVLAASVKYMVGFIIVFYFVLMIRQLHMKRAFFNDWRLIAGKFAPYIISSLVLFIFCIPFGLIDVVVSVFIYQGFTSFRGEVAQSVGPLLIEILGIASLEDLLYLPLALIIVIGAFVYFRNHSDYEQILHFSFLSMMILPFYATELFITIPFYVWFKEGKKYLITEELTQNK
jgi:hypothetical protein